MTECSQLGLRQQGGRGKAGPHKMWGEPLAYSQRQVGVGALPLGTPASCRPPASQQPPAGRGPSCWRLSPLWWVLLGAMGSCPGLP